MDSKEKGHSTFLYSFAAGLRTERQFELTRSTVDHFSYSAPSVPAAVDTSEKKQGPFLPTFRPEQGVPSR